MSLDPDARVVIEMLEQYDYDMSEMSTAGARSMMEQLSELASGTGPELHNVEDIEISVRGGIDARVYDPVERETPVVVFFHGGGFVIGNIETHDVLCRMIADKSECTVVSVGYGLAPENPFPDPVLDSYYSVLWIRNNADEVPGEIDVSRLGVAGDSAGGNLSAVVSLMARDRGLPDIGHQALLYPSTALDNQLDSRYEFREGYFLTVDDLAWFFNRYFERETDPQHPYAFPLQARSLENLPPAHVVTAGYDPLRDEGRCYADRLEEEGVDVSYTEYEGMIHGFLTMDSVIDRAEEAVSEIASEINENLTE
ncbi:MAG: alpha/beta hydrolase [Halobacteria archaeon]